ncbi:MAG: TatD family hydrolase [Patescibacteria group bacterium]
MPLKFIDTHCHVHFQAYTEDVDAVVQRALESGVGMITVGTQSTTSKNGITLAEKYDGVWCTIGLHPNHLHAQDFLDENELPPGVVDDLNEHDGPAHIKTRAERFDPEYYRELAKHPKVVGIGELGLDYYRVPPGVELEQLKADQQAQAREQLRFATEVDKPVVIHCRDAHADQARLLEEEIAVGGLSRRGVIHCFTGTPEEAKRYVDLGFYISFSGIVTFGKNVMASAKSVPLNRLLIETDSPYLTPAPFRGQRNEPAYVEHIAAKIAELHGVSVDEVARITTQNACNVFRLSI